MLAVAAATVALALAWHYKLGMPKMLAMLLPTAPTLHVAWASFQAARGRAAGKLDLAGVAGQDERFSEFW